MAEQCPPSLSWALAGQGRQQPRPPVTKQKGQKHALGFVPHTVPWCKVSVPVPGALVGILCQQPEPRGCVAAGSAVPFALLCQEAPGYAHGCSSQPWQLWQSSDKVSGLSSWYLFILGCI